MPHPAQRGTTRQFPARLLCKLTSRSINFQLIIRDRLNRFIVETSIPERRRTCVLHIPQAMSLAPDYIQLNIKCLDYFLSRILKPTLAFSIMLALPASASARNSIDVSFRGQDRGDNTRHA